eukprot:m.80061 g.80061  ORF g.80061 m.80061 type:complete len:513 (-) comp12736_c0_seq5:99-1637(-)
MWFFVVLSASVLNLCGSDKILQETPGYYVGPTQGLAHCTQHKSTTAVYNFPDGQQLSAVCTRNVAMLQCLESTSDWILLNTSSSTSEVFMTRDAHELDDATTVYTSHSISIALSNKPPGTSHSCRNTVVLRPAREHNAIPQGARVASVDMQTFSGTCSNETREALLIGVDKNFYEQTLKELSGNVAFQLSTENNPATIITRETWSSDNERSAQYLKEKCEEFGLQVIVQNFISTSNIICVKAEEQGSNSDIIVVGAHYDSLATDSNSAAPGAVDNGSGSAAVLTLAKAFATMKVLVRIHFVFFGMEEQGLHGSAAYVNTYGDNVLMALTLDMIGYSNDFFGATIEHLPSVPLSQTIANATIDIIEELNDHNVFTTLYPSATSFAWKEFTAPFGSDHISFITNNIPALLLIELDDINYQHYHKRRDTVNNINYDQSLIITTVTGLTLYDFACPPEYYPPPTTITTTTTKTSTTTTTTITTSSLSTSTRYSCASNCNSTRGHRYILRSHNRTND